jgi:hypothetical protein
LSQWALTILAGKEWGGCQAGSQADRFQTVAGEADQ